jgi:hypothetical protein
VTGYVIYLLNIPVCLRSKLQKGVTLLSTEAEYTAISEAVKEVSLSLTYSVIFISKSSFPLLSRLKILKLFLCRKMHQPAFIRGTLTQVITLYISLLKTVLSKLNLFGLLRTTRTFLRRMSVTICM